jgi:uncharacterized protein
MPHEPITERAELERLLNELRHGVLATAGVDGQPYTTPINHLYRDGKLYFHCALHGRKLDNILANPRVCFTAYKAQRLVFGDKACECAQRYESVICFGTARVVEEVEFKTEILTRLSESYAGREYAPPSLARVNGTTVVEITVRKMTGKRNVDRIVVGEDPRED